MEFTLAGYGADTDELLFVGEGIADTRTAEELDLLTDEHFFLECVVELILIGYAVDNGELLLAEYEVVETKTVDELINWNVELVGYGDVIELEELELAVGTGNDEQDEAGSGVVTSNVMSSKSSWRTPAPVGP